MTVAAEFAVGLFNDVSTRWDQADGTAQSITTCYLMSDVTPRGENAQKMDCAQI